METLHEAPIFKANIIEHTSGKTLAKDSTALTVDELLAERQFQSDQHRLTLIIIVLWTIVQLIALFKNLFIYRILNEPLAYTDQLIKRSIPWAAGIFFIFLINYSTIHVRKLKVGLKHLPLVHFLVATLISILIFVVCFYSVQGLGLSTFENSSVQKYLMLEIDRLFLIYLLISITTTAHHYFHELRLKELTLVKLEKAYQEAQIISLNNQVNPHMISNTLNNISALISTDIKEAQKMIVDFAQLLRQNLKSKETIYTTLIHEKKFIKTYVNLQNSQVNKRYNIKFSFPPEIKLAILPKMILQPLVENAIKHAHSEDKATLEILIQAERNKNHLRINVQNNTTSPRHNGIIKNIGVGTENIIRRLQVLYSNNFSFEVFENDEHFTCQLKIPFSLNTS